MLTHPTLDRLQTLKLTGMVKALTEQLALPEAEGLPFLERLGLLVDREETERQSRRLLTRLRAAALREQATRWHASVGDPTLADAILDRLVHNAYKIELRGIPCARSGRPSMPSPGKGRPKDRNDADVATAVAHQVRRGHEGGFAPPKRPFFSPQSGHKGESHDTCVDVPLKVAALRWIGWPESSEYALHALSA